MTNFPNQHGSGAAAVRPRLTGPGVRSPLRTILGAYGLAAVAACGAVTGSPPPPPAPGPAAAPEAATSTFVMVIRHAEKPEGKSSGIDQTGRSNKSAITEAGWERARDLVGILDPAGAAPSRPGLARPAAI